MLRVSARQFSTTPRAQALGDLYQRLTSWGRRKTPEELHDPTKETKSQDDLPEDSVPRKLRVLGKPPAKSDGWELIEPSAKFAAWPTNFYKKDLTVDSITSAVEEHFTDAAKNDLQARFQGIKNVTQALGVAIPDAKLSLIDSKEALVSHLKSVSRQFDEKQPDAIYFDTKEFEGTNITFSDPIVERQERKKRYNALLREAQTAEREQAQKALSSEA